MAATSLLLMFSILIWGIVHSLLAASTTKERVRRWFGISSDRWYRISYNIFSIITFMPILGLLTMAPGETLYVIPVPWSYLALAGQLLALVALGVGLLQTGLWSFLGFEQLLIETADGKTQMITSGLYRYVRHPLYTAGLLFIWLTPVMTVNLLLLNIGLTIYLMVGTIYEERKLVREFGSAYTSYQELVPMLIPFLKRQS